MDRNLLKRRLREIGRRQVLTDLGAKGAVVDVLIRARAGAYEAAFEELTRDVMGAVEELWSQSS